MKIKATFNPTKLKKQVNILVNAFGTQRRPGSLLLVARDEAEDICKALAQEMRNTLYNQRFKMAPLSPAYFAWKVKKGLDKRTLIATKKYVKAIGVVKTPYGALIGLVRKTRNDKGRILKYALLQRWLEFGTRARLPSGKKGKIGSRMPARPHWRPQIRYWKAHRKDYGLKIKTKVGFELRKLLRAAS